MRRKAQGFTLIEIMVVIAIIAGLVTTVAIMVPKMQESQRQLSCQGNLHELVMTYKTHALENEGKAQKWAGVSLWLSYRKNGDDIKIGQEKALWCPGDKQMQLPETDDERKKWDVVDLLNPADNLCSYAARDFQNFPIRADTKTTEIIGCDRQGMDGKTPHHRNVIMAGFDEGNVSKLSKEELGLSTEQDIVVGPEASNKDLKKCAYIVRKKD